ncbi:hypothetical protein DMH04_14375 [Kibdelosporangium aridum]|uniref:Tetratricopeptide repeat protein n=1 Tax=Kibdelosporangium aridum TaxID=2030 RepID=A0A428ZE45_KIBAR|nr:hypothetical protein [Kibdelosporangium aridum]RSM86344.1 hypothetical protein DMH04_14375 [Kibdelosporangium aridum]
MAGERPALPSGPQWKAGTYLGRVHRDNGQLDQARQRYLEELALVQELVDETTPPRPGDDTAAKVALRDLGIVEENLGDLALQTGDRAAAGRHYRASRAALHRIPDAPADEMRLLDEKMHRNGFC